MLSQIVDGGAKVIGFDVIFPSSIEQSEIPFGETPIGARMRGFDRDYLVALRQMSDAGKLVLGQVLSNDHPDLPYRAQQLAVRDNIRTLNVHTDIDDVIRRMPLRFGSEGKYFPAMAVELASRALAATPEFSENGAMTIEGYAVPSAVPNTLTLNFRGAGRDVPAFSFADLRACVEKGDREFFRRAFDGKVVILGTVLNFEDRKLTSMRLGGTSDGAVRAALRPARSCDQGSCGPQRHRRRLRARRRRAQPDRARRRARARLSLAVSPDHRDRGARSRRGLPRWRRPARPPHGSSSPRSTRPLPSPCSRAEWRCR